MGNVIIRNKDDGHPKAYFDTFLSPWVNSEGGFNCKQE
jgi:hypothetical protein